MSRPRSGRTVAAQLRAGHRLGERALGCVIAYAALIGCGARSDLTVLREHADGGMDAAVPAPDAAPARDAGRFAAPPDAGAPDAFFRDAFVPDAFVPTDAIPGCSTDAECDDGIACTDDRCEGGRCAPSTPRDALCDDGRFCNGEERCAPRQGCVPGAAPCEDGIECTDDVCVEPALRCENDPVTERCPTTRECRPLDGCILRAVVNHLGRLYEIGLPSGALIPGPAVAPGLTDVAVSDDGELYGVTNLAIYRIDYAAGVATRIASGGGSALEFGPDGELYGADLDQVYRYDVDSGERESVARIGDDELYLRASGDIAFLGDRMLLTAEVPGGESELLVEVDLSRGVSQVVGDTGEGCIWGLAARDGMLYGLTCTQRLLAIDPGTGAGTVVAMLEDSIYGASVR